MKNAIDRVTMVTEPVTESGMQGDAVPTIQSGLHT